MPHTPDHEEEDNFAEESLLLLRFDRLFDSILQTQENRMGRQLRSFFNTMADQMRIAWQEQGVLGAQAVIANSDLGIQEILNDNYIRAGLAGGGLSIDMMNADLLEDEEEQDLNEEALLALLVAWAAQEKVIVSKQLRKTTIDILNELIVEGEEAGLNGSDLVDNVTKELKRRNRNRTGTIATTEAGNAISLGQQKTSEVLQFELKKSWRSQGDLIVRDSHARANSRYMQEPIAIDQLFQVGASRGKYPRDPMLSQAERINCRCYTFLRKIR